ncbi:Hypothetical predicted protein [Octopus vulgaris]|uniref:Uncharacterized protein n=1 Tax=Octopus vulgaris TaxID=6645 RepID=A0AA36AIU1_OCTVU|nr:Hypothetical predicted protein [Octopus vulgaris]
MGQNGGIIGVVVFSVSKKVMEKAFDVENEMENGVGNEVDKSELKLTVSSLQLLYTVIALGININVYFFYCVSTNEVE